jgi:oxygen-independent coproporphyrinogen-3 oxidase
MEGEIVPRTVRALVAEVERSPHRGRKAKTLYFGGGTPTYLDPSSFEQIFRAVTDAHPLIPGCEITVEANPGTVDASRYRCLRDLGVNRLSLGAQSFEDEDLVLLGRVHRSSEIEKAYELARSAGFENVNLDLMFGLPRQSLEKWERNLDKALSLHPEHLSLYNLTIEPNTRFYKEWKRGFLVLPEEDVQRAMFDLAREKAKRSGYRAYEISNYALPGRECQHNLCYWRGEEYVAYGPGAVERVGNVRRTHLKHPLRYCEAVERGESLWCEVELLDEATLRLETLMLRLRLDEGLSLEEIPLEEEKIQRVIKRGWVNRKGERLVLTDEGFAMANQVILSLV